MSHFVKKENVLQTYRVILRMTRRNVNEQMSPLDRAKLRERNKLWTARITDVYRKNKNVTDAMTIYKVRKNIVKIRRHVFPASMRLSF